MSNRITARTDALPGATLAPNALVPTARALEPMVGGAALVRSGMEPNGPDRPEGWPAPAPCPLDALRSPGLQDVASPAARHGGIACDPGTEPLVWVQDGLSRSELGAVHARGLAARGIDPARVTLVRVSRPLDALWAMEEALRAGMAVVGEIEGCSRALDFTATRRLEWRARAAGVSCWLVRVGSRARATGGSSGARYRWRVSPHSSAPDPHDEKAPGRPRWRLELLRARDRPPGAWVVEVAPDDVAPDRQRPRAPDGEAPPSGATASSGAAHRLRVVAPLAGGGVAPDDLPRRREPAAVVPLRPGRAA